MLYTLIMCGIAGTIGFSTENKEKIIGDMVSAIIHRGPDQDGFFVDDFVGLGMRRLSIIDISTGKQPITSRDGKRMIFFNGEIYNYLELHDELAKKGVGFKTKSDTEVILHMYEEYGEKMLTRLRGMFAFCIYDTEKQTIFIARDFFGIKPLYYMMHDEKVLGFSSEIKSFLSYPDFKPVVNDSAVYNYLSFQYNPLTETFFQGVYKLLPAHYMKIDAVTGVADIQKYWQFEFNQNEKLDKKGTEQKVYKTVKDSVAHHMIADVPVGSFLSGGVDSSIIATLMQEIRGEKKIKTFTVGFESLSEGIESKETSEFLGTDHTEITVSSKQYFNALPDAVWHFDEPVADPSAIGLYFVAQEARKHVTVVLSGEGADELFGGYNIYLEPFARAKIVWIPRIILRVASRVADILPDKFWGKNYVQKASMQLEEWYIGNASIFKKNEISKLWKEKSKHLESLHPLYSQIGKLSESTQMQYIDIHTWLVGDILAKADKMTMAHSLELRVPFLDIEIAKLASTIPDKLKWPQGNMGATKYILREAFKKVIPESTRNRKKLGFPTPVRNWFTTERQKEYDTILHNEYIKSHMNVSEIQKLIDDHVSKRVDNSRKIYLLLLLALWYDIFILNKKPHHD
ncbi:MAG: asparagine synthase (glutamine-hydrolyzing) [Patescibacteria group bacterium]